MPRLPAEPCLFPATLFDEPSPLLPLEPDEVRAVGWWVVHTRARTEKALARRLVTDAVRFFLPLYDSTSQVGKRTVTTHLPLFPGYVFVWGDSAVRYHVLTTNRVASCIPVKDQRRLESDLTDIYRLMTNDADLTPAPVIPPGTLVEVVDGPFAGLVGTVSGAGADRKLYVEVQILHQGVGVKLDEWSVRPLAGPVDATWRRDKLLVGQR